MNLTGKVRCTLLLSPDPDRSTDKVAHSVVPLAVAAAELIIMDFVNTVLVSPMISLMLGRLNPKGYGH